MSISFAMPAATAMPSTLVRFALYGFVFSIPLEYPPRTIPFETHTITATILLLVAAMQPQAWLRWPAAAVWCFAAYLWVFVARALFAQHSDLAAKLFGNYLLVALVFWLSSDLLRVPRVARTVLVTFVSSCALVALLQFTAPQLMAANSELARRTVLGQDPNVLGGNMALALVALVGLGGHAGLGAGHRLAAIVVALLLGSALAASGSRGAFVAAAVGLLAFGVAGRRHMTQRVIAFLTIVLVIGSVAVSGPLRLRSEQTLQSGSLSGREYIYPAAWHMFRERPLIGWAPIDNRYELAWRTAIFPNEHGSEDGMGRPARDTHNMVLEVLTATGVVGAVPFSLCLILCLRAAWQARSGPAGATALALIVVVVMLNLSVNWSASKAMWLFLGYAVAASPKR